jgi:predicted RNA polymerase sigma factor
MLRCLDRTDAARAAYRRAPELAPESAERDHLLRRREKLAPVT